MMRIVLLILWSATMIAMGQVCFKKGVAPLPTPDLRSARSYGNFLKSVFAAPAIWLGFGSVALGIVIWLVALAQTDLSVAFPLDSLQYLVIILAARMFLGEKIDIMKLFGTLMIIAGIVLISRSLSE